MTNYEKSLILNFVKDLKHSAIHSQSYEIAARSRDLEKVIQNFSDSQVFLESSQFWYDSAHKIYESITNGFYNYEFLRSEQKKLYESLFRQKIRSEIISKILEDPKNNQHD
jgi:hypothetical protein